MKCQMPDCQNPDRDGPTIAVDIGDDAEVVLREACADCLVDEP